jgi:hypothetical protein
MRYDMDNLLDYWKSLDDADKERLLYWISNELNAARARIWLFERDYMFESRHEYATKERFNGGF